MMPGMPGGRQFAAWLSSGGLANDAALLAAYSGVSDGPPPRPAAAPPPPPLRAAPAAGAPAPRFPAAAPASGDGAPPARAPPPPPPVSQTPVKSGSLASAVQSAGAGAFAVERCANASEPAADASPTTTNPMHILRLLFIRCLFAHENSMVTVRLKPYSQEKLGIRNQKLGIAGANLQFPILNYSQFLISQCPSGVP